MKYSAIFAKALLFSGLAVGLAACDGKEDFSDIGRGDCPIGGNCRIEARGDLLVELSGPVVGGLGYMCSGSVEYIQLEESANRNGELIPAGMAACPTEAKDITFYLGRATDGSNYVELGKAYLPAIGRATLHTGSEREIVRLTWADVIKSPRRVTSEDLGNRLKLLAKLDDGSINDEFTQPPVHFPRCVNDALDIYLTKHGETSPELVKALADAVELGELTSWDTFFSELEAGNVVDTTTGENICEEFGNPSNALTEEHLKNALRFAMNATRAGTLLLSYQDESLLAHLVSEKVELAPNPKKLGQVSGNVLVFPDGSVRGFPTTTLFERDEERDEEGTIRRDLLGIGNGEIGSNATNILNDDLSLTLGLDGLGIKAPKFLSNPPDNEKNHWKYLDTEAEGTAITITGTFLGSAIFDGVVWEPEGVKKHDGQEVYPHLPEAEQVKDGEKGRFSGDFLNVAVNDLLVNPNQDKAPIRVVRSSYGSTQMHTSVTAKLEDQKFVLQLMRACVDGDDDCLPIPEEDKANYPTEVKYESGLTVGQGGDVPGTGTIVMEDDVYDSHTALVEELLLSIKRDEEHLYIEHDGQRVGYISHTEVFTDEGEKYPQSAIFTMIFDQQALKALTDNRQYLYGVEIQGRLDLRTCEQGENQFYRLSDDSFKAKLTAGWIGNYWALKSLEEVAVATNDALKPKLIYAQGSAYLFPEVCP